MIVDGPHDPRLTRQALDHIESGTTDMAESVLRVPLSYYRSPQLADKELELLRRTPIALAMTGELPAPHDYLVRKILGISVLVSRAVDGTARAFLNYCRHRGAQPASGCGNTRRFACPYHGWVYDSLGMLVGIPGASGFAEIDREATGLVELPSEERHGILWATLTSGAELDLDAHLGPLAEELDEWKLAEYVPLTHREFEGDVNWKAALEAFAESYHFPYVHGNSIVGQNTMSDITVQVALGRHQRVCFPLAWIDKKASNLEPVRNLAMIYWIWPNLVVAFSEIGAELIDILPNLDASGRADPSRCTVRHGWASRRPAASDAERSAYEQLYEQVHAALRDEDFGVLPQCGRAIAYAQHGHMIIGRNEIGVQHVVGTFCQALGVDLHSSTETAAR
ncbi:MAG TPA: aromatic ring-hydroxylating dioxygenase subunit alpha [Acidimicrobiales bacterium]|nr:aromatic ring-hydroxylating dioxygenase subunit alpha [Acidimicrobiales bacterium]